MEKNRQQRSDLRMPVESYKNVYMCSVNNNAMRENQEI